MVSFLKALISGALNSSMDGDVQSAFPSTAEAMPAGILPSESKRQRNIRAGNKNSPLKDREPSQPPASEIPMPRHPQGASLGSPRGPPAPPALPSTTAGAARGLPVPQQDPHSPGEPPTQQVPCAVLHSPSPAFLGVVLAAWQSPHTTLFFPSRRSWSFLQRGPCAPGS